MTTIWVDAQLSPRVADWIGSNFPVKAWAVRDLGLRDATDEAIFAAAHVAKAVVLTKDSVLFVCWSSMVVRQKSSG